MVVLLHSEINDEPALWSLGGCLRTWPEIVSRYLCCRQVLTCLQNKLRGIEIKTSHEIEYPQHLILVGCVSVLLGLGIETAQGLPTHCYLGTT